MSSSDRDYRRDKRVTFTMPARLATGPGADCVIADASMVDLSESGVRVRLCGQIVPGQIVEIFLNKRPERCRVVWTCPADAKKELIAGLEFIAPLPEPRGRQTPPESRCEPVN
ncbi:MAG: PilZ domain-containing protein [Terriglobia bacterium]